MMWFPINGIKRSLIPSANNTKKKAPNHFFRLQKKQPKVGILAFETAKTMSRLVSLYKSLSDAELLKLRSEIIKFEGATLLNSKDESFLLKLAYAEKLEEIDSIAVTVSRFSKKCSDQELNRFEQVYSDLKHDSIDSGTLNFGSKDVKKIVKQMEKFITATSRLYSGLEALGEMEISEQRLNKWKNYNTSVPGQKTNYDLFNQKISWQRQQVRYLRQISLWGQTFNKTIMLLARIVCIVYARIRNAFSPYISVIVLPSGSFRHTLSAEALPPVNDSSVEDIPVSAKSGPIPKHPGVVKFWSRELNKTLRPRSIDIGVNFAIAFRENRFFGLNIIQKTSRLVHQAPPSTLGGSGLALRYANVIIVAEKYQNSPASLNDTGREDLYQMLPESVRNLVRTKMKKIWRKGMDEKCDEKCDASTLTEYWQETLREILVWFAPMAHNTVRWQQERSFEKRNFDAKPKVLLLQTLFFADRDKTEWMIAEVLVRLTWMYRYGLDNL